MKRKSILTAFAAAAALASAVAVGIAPAAGAASTECSGVLTGTIAGNLVVPDGAACVLSSAHVEGNVAVGIGARLHGISYNGTPTTIDGNVTGTDVDSILLQYRTQVGGNFVVDGASSGISGFDIGVRIGGNATILDNAGYTFVDAASIGRNVDVQGSTGGIEVEWNTVGGNENVSQNVPATLSVYGNQASGNLTVSTNTGSGYKQVIDNTAGRNLTCEGNDTPFVTSANSGARMHGQCG